MGAFLKDLRYGIRMLAKNPGFTMVAVITLALGIGANVAIFSLIHAILLKMLPVGDPEQLVLLRWESPQAKTDFLPYPTFAHFRDDSHVFSGMFAFYNLGIATAVDGTPGVAAGQLVSGNYFSVLGVEAIAGRTFTSEEDRVPGGDPVAESATDIGGASSPSTPQQWASPSRSTDSLLPLSASRPPASTVSPSATGERFGSP